MNINWQRMKNIQRIHRVLYALGLGPLVGGMVLLLTTTGRKTGQKRVTPLQYEVINGLYYLGAARGLKADWVRNIQANPQVEVRVKASTFQGQAKIVTDPVRVADFLAIRLQRHPLMIGMILQRVHGLPKQSSREQLEKWAEKEALVIIAPVEFSEN